MLDTDVLVVAMRSRGGASWQLVDRALAAEFTLLWSVPLVLEYEAVLTREEHRKGTVLACRNSARFLTRSLESLKQCR